MAWPRARSPDWLKFKNPAAPAVRREAEGGLGKAPMTTLTLRMIKGDFIVTGPDCRAHQMQAPPRGQRLVRQAPSGIAD